MTIVRSDLTDFRPPGITGRPRLALWVLLLAMTAAIILYPANLKYEYSIHTLPFIYVFDNFSLFVALFYIWVLLILVLLFTRGSETRINWEKAALVGIFAIVFTGYYTFISRGLVGDAFAPAGDIKNLVELGHYTGAPSLKYMGFSGFSLLGTGVCLVTGLEITDYMAFFPFFQILVFSMLLYLFFNKLLKNPYFASLGVLLVIQVDLSVATALPQFHAGVFAPFCLLSAALLLFTAGRAADNRRLFRMETNETLILVVLAALFISHFITSIVAFLTILGIFIIQKISGKYILSTKLVVLLLIVPVIWNLPQNFSIIKYFIAMIPDALADLSSGQIIREWLLPLQTTSYIGERSYLWTMPSLYLGPLLLIVIGGILGLARLVRIRRLDEGEIIGLGGLAGIVILALVLLFLGGLQESYGRTLIYIALFTVPIILWRVFHLKTLRKYIFSLLVAVLFIVSLPSFLLSSKAIASGIYYPSEIASGEFLESGFGRGSGIHVYDMGNSASHLTYRLLDAYMDYAYYPDFRSEDEEDIWHSMNQYVSSVKKPEPAAPDTPASPNIIMFSPKWDAPFRDFIGIDVKNSPEWYRLESRLAENDLIYSNSFVQIYYVSP